MIDYDRDELHGRSMKIWIDADACPNVIKDILFRAADKRQLPLILVANRFIAKPPSPLRVKI